ncbi:MAG: hypothetical protein AAF196_19745 [Planctomycetota bacterium]
MPLSRDALLDYYDAVIATQPEVARKGKANPYTSCKGRMFSFVTKENELAIRLNDEDREAFLKKHKTKPIIVYGTVMKEYVRIPESLIRRTKELAKTFAKSFEHFDSLPQNPTTKPKKKGSTKKAAKKTTRKKATAKKSPRKKAVSKKAPAKKDTRKKTATKKATRKKSATRNVAAKKKPAARKAPNRKTASRKKPTRKKR